MLHALRSLCRDRYIQSATNRAVALRWLRSDRYVHIGCVALHALRSVRCVASVSLVRDVTYRTVALRRLHSFRSHRSDLNGTM